MQGAKCRMQDLRFRVQDLGCSRSSCLKHKANSGLVLWGWHAA